MTDRKSTPFEFAASFVWIGPCTPAEQTYEILGLEFNSIAGGITAPTVPEPSAVARLLAGIALIAAAQRKRGG